MGTTVHNPGAREPRPLRVCPRRRAARRARDARQDAARHPARPPDQGGLHRRDRGRQARGLPEPELHRRLRALLCALPRSSTRTRSSTASARRAASPAAPGRRQARRRPAGAAAAQPMAGGFRPDFPLTRGCEARRAAGDPALGDRLGAGAGRPARRPRLRRLDGAAEHPAGAVRPGRGAAAGGGRGRRRSTAPEAPPLEEPALTELASPVAATALADLYRQQEPRCRSWCRATARSPRSTRTGPACSRGPAAAPARGGRAEVPAALIAAGGAGRIRGRTALRPRSRRAAAPAAGRGRRARRLDPGLPGERHGHLREHPREGRDLSPPEGIEAPLIWAGNSGRSTCGSARRCAGRSAAAPGRPRTWCWSRRRSPSATTWWPRCPR